MVEGDAVRVQEAGMEDVIEVAVIGICLQVFSSETWPKIAGQKICTIHLDSLVLSRMFTCLVIIILGSQGVLGLFNLWIQLMLPMRNITWMVKFFLAVS